MRRNSAGGDGGDSRNGVAIGGTVDSPQLGQVARERLDLLARGLAAGHAVLGELGLGVLEFSELRPPFAGW